MVFNSYIFILLFLPVTLLIYFGLNSRGKERAATWGLIGMSLVFYGYFHWAYLGLLIISILANYICSQAVLVQTKSIFLRKTYLITGIVINIGGLVYFKYTNFLLENVNHLIGTEFSMHHILLPLGISFLTFQQIAYLVDSYRGETGGYSFSDYVLYIVFFPKIASGPIVLHQDLVPQFSDSTKKHFDHNNFSHGLWLFLIGLFKKVMLADVLAKGADWGFSNISILNGADAAIVAVLYTLQIYFDFSGYCDMAGGISNMFNFNLPLNFNSPYKATSILEFWQRWHISLTSFFRKYVYIPLGGSRKGTVRTMINVLAIFLLSGLWHGAEWTFVLWGLMHGIANVLCRIFCKAWEKIPAIIRSLCTFCYVALAWVVFRAPNVPAANILFQKLFMGWSADTEINHELLHQFDLLEFTYIEDHVGALGSVIDRFPWLHLAVVMVVSLWIVFIPQNCQKKEFVPSMKNAVGSVVLLIWSIVSLAGLSTFLYFNF